MKFLQQYVTTFRNKPTRVKLLSGDPLLGRLLALTTNIRLGWKGVSETYALACYEKS